MSSVWNVVCVFISTGYFRSWYLSLVFRNSVGGSSWIALQIGKKRRRNRTESKILVIVCTCACVRTCLYVPACVRGSLLLTGCCVCEQ
jgi:hypothetical protein